MGLHFAVIIYALVDDSEFSLENLLRNLPNLLSVDFHAYGLRTILFFFSNNNET